MLFMKNYVFELLRKLSKLRPMCSGFDAAQNLQYGVIRRVNDNMIGSANDKGCSLNLFANFSHLLRSYNYIVVRCFGFCPSRLRSFSSAGNSLIRCEPGGPGWTAFFTALSSQSDGGGIFLPFCYSHNCIIRERSGWFSLASRLRKLRRGTSALLALCVGSRSKDFDPLRRGKGLGWMSLPFQWENPTNYSEEQVGLKTRGNPQCSAPNDARQEECNTKGFGRLRRF